MVNIPFLIHALFTENGIEFGRIKLVNDRVELGEVHSDRGLWISFGIEWSLRIQLEEQPLDFRQREAVKIELVLEEGHEAVAVDGFVFVLSVR